MNNEPNEINAFLNLLTAGILDAATERKMTQLLTQCQPDGMKMQKVRIIIVPETMDFEWPKPLKDIKR